MQPSRRSLLLSTGSALALGAAGCLGQAAPAQQSDDGDATDSADDGSNDLPAGLKSAFEYVYPPDDDGAMVRITRHTADDDSQRMGLHPTLEGTGDPEWVLFVQAESNPEQPGRHVVASGDFEVDGDDYASDGSRGDFDRYRVQTDTWDGPEQVLLTDGDILLLGQEDRIDATFAAREAGDETYLEASPGARALLDAVEFSGSTILLDDDSVREPFQQVDVETADLPDAVAVEFVQTDDAISYALAGWYEETPDSDDAETLQSLLTEQLSMSEPTVEIDETDQVVVVEASREYVPPEERPETVGMPRFEAYDEETGEVLFRFDRGESLPVDRYEIEIDGEVYEGDWARGQSEIGEGDTIAIDANAIEPGDEFTISYESSEGYGSSYGTSLLGHLPFETDFDPGARTATVTYDEGPPLQADRVSLVVGDEERVVQPWSGELSEGDSTTLSDLPIDSHLAVEYERSDGETVTIGHGSLRPPGRFEFEYDGAAEMLTVQYPDLDAQMDDAPPRARRHVPDQEPLDADRYEIRVDGEAASQQWTDVGDEVDPGDSVQLQNVPVDTSVSVAWIGEDGTRHDMAETLTLPDVEFEFEYDADASELTIRHASGQAVDPGPLGVRLHDQDDERTVDWEADGSVSEGDEFTVEDVGERVFAVVTYREHHLEHVHTSQLRNDE